MTIASLTEVKGISLIINALSRIDQDHLQKIKWVIIGDGPLYSKLIKDIKSANLQNQLFLVGKKEDVFSWLKQCNIYVNTSMWEGCPYSILEAMAAEKPIIAADVPGCRDLIESGETGVLFNRDNLEDLISLIKSAIHEADIWLEYASKAAQKVRSSYSATTMQNHTQNLYKKIIEK